MEIFSWKKRKRPNKNWVTTQDNDDDNGGNFFSYFNFVNYCLSLEGICSSIFIFFSIFVFLFFFQEEFYRLFTVVLYFRGLSLCIFEPSSVLLCKLLPTLRARNFCYQFRYFLLCHNPVVFLKFLMKFLLVLIII